MKTEKYVKFLERELEILKRDTKEEMEKYGFCLEHECRLKELALVSAIAFYAGEKVLALEELKEYELHAFLKYFKDAIDMKVISPIREDEYWTETCPGLYRNERYQLLLKMIDPETGEVLYSDDAKFVTCNIRNLRRSQPDEIEMKALLELFPLAFPYMPPTRPIILYVDDDGRRKYLMYACDLEGVLQKIDKIYQKNDDGIWVRKEDRKCEERK